MHGKNLIWLASYPKSGNTWVRLFLQHVLYGDPSPDGFPSPSAIPIASNRKLIDDMLGIRSGNLAEDEIENLRPGVYREMAKKGDETRVIKVHDSYHLSPKGEALFPAEVSRKVIYILRNPLDLVVSYAFHSGKSFDRIIAQLNDPGFTISGSKTGLRAQVRQKLGSWTQHVESWTRQSEIDVHILRFEDLLGDPAACFRTMLNAAAIPCEKDIFEEALRATAFDRLREKEQRYGFREKPLQAASFFRKGKSGDFGAHLNKAQIRKVLDAHGPMMEQYAYPVI